MKASDLFIKALEKENIDYIFGIPGEENLDFLNSLKGSKIKLILTRHEQAAGFMAATIGRLTGKTGVCLSTLGPGATNFVTAAAYAQLGGMPMMMITGQKPIKSSKQGQFQIVDIVNMMKPLTKYTKQIVAGDNIPSRVREAIRLAEEEKPGAVHLELPEDIAADLTDASLIEKSQVRRSVAEEKSILQAVELLQKAKHPLLLIGAGANRKMTSKMLLEFINKSKIPFFTTQMGKGVIDERHELCLGCAALSSKDFVHRAIENADLILNVGHDVVEKPPFFMGKGNLQVIHINFFSASVDPVYFPQVEVVGDIANSIWQLSQKTKASSNWDFKYFHHVKKKIDEHLLEGASDPRFPIYPQRMVQDIRAVLPEDGMVCLDNGVYKIWFARNYRAYQSNTVLLDNALATMGAGLPSAIASKIVFPNRKVVSVCGDGGFMMNSQELETAIRLNLDLVVIILRDNAYGMIKWKQANMNFENFGLDYGNPDFLKYAEAYGAKGYRIESTEGFKSTLKQVLDTKGVHLIDLPVDYSENDRILNHEIGEKAKLI